MTNHDDTRSGTPWHHGTIHIHSCSDFPIKKGPWEAYQNTGMGMVVTEKVKKFNALTILMYFLKQPYGYGSIPINTIFRGMNIHLPAILMFTRGIGFWPIPILYIYYIPPGRGCRPEVSHVTNSVGFVWGLSRFTFRVLGFLPLF